MVHAEHQPVEMPRQKQHQTDEVLTNRVFDQDVHRTRNDYCADFRSLTLKLIHHCVIIFHMLPILDCWFGDAVSKVKLAIS